MTIDTQALDCLNLLTFATDSAGRITSWNEAMVEATGRPASAVVGKKSWEAFFPKRRKTPIDEALAEADTVEDDLTFVHGKSGAETSFTLRVVPIVGDDGEAKGAVALLTSGEKDDGSRLRSAIDGSATAMMMIDRDLIITYVNPATEKLIRDNLATFVKAYPTLNPDKLVGTCIDIFHKNPAHQRNILGNANNLPHKATIQVGELSFALSVSAMRDAAGAHIGATLEWVNVTEARASALAAARLSSQVEGSGVGVMVCDVNRVISYCNPAVMDLLRKYEADLRKVFPSFDARRLVGTSIDQFHKNPRHQAAMLTDHRAHPVRTEISVGALRFGLNLASLYDADQNYIGNSVEWTDLNDRVA
jgi:methyl-accepting chemotaxis protein